MTKIKICFLSFVAIFAVLGGVPAHAAVTVTHTGPSTYADPQWRSFCLSNKPVDELGVFIAGGQYRAIVEVCPSTSNANAPAPCSTSQWLGLTITAGLQTVITYFITSFWCPAHPGYCS